LMMLQQCDLLFVETNVQRDKGKVSRVPTTDFWLSGWANADNISIKVEIDPSMIRGQRGVFGPALLINIACTPIVAPGIAGEATLHSLDGWITWADEGNFGLGIRIPSQTVDPNTTSLLVPITDEQIKAINDRRSGDYVTLDVMLRGLATIPNPRVKVAQTLPRQQQQGMPRLETKVVWEPRNAGQRVNIPLATWLTILKGLGAAKRRLVELPEPKLPPADSASWETCLGLLSKASEAFPDKTDVVLSNCRRVIEGVVVVLGNHFGITRDPKKPMSVWAKDLPDQLKSVWSNDPEASRLFFALLAAAFTWSSDTHHYNATVPQRDEAAFALELTTDLLVFGTQILEATTAIP